MAEPVKPASAALSLLSQSYIIQSIKTLYPLYFNIC